MRKATVATMSFVTIIVAGLIALLIWSMRRGREGFAFKNREFTHMKIYFGNQDTPETFYFNDADVQKMIPPKENEQPGVLDAWDIMNYNNSEIALVLARMYSRDLSRIQSGKKHFQKYKRLPASWLKEDLPNSSSKHKAALQHAYLKPHTVSLCNKIGRYGQFWCN